MTGSQDCQPHKPHPTKSPKAGYHLGSCSFSFSLNNLLLLLLFGLLHQKLRALCLLLGCGKSGQQHWKQIPFSEPSTRTLQAWRLASKRTDSILGQNSQLRNVSKCTLLFLKQNQQHPDPTQSDKSSSVTRNPTVLGTQSLRWSIPVAMAQSFLIILCEITCLAQFLRQLRFLTLQLYQCKCNDAGPNSASLFNNSMKMQRQFTLSGHKLNSPTCLASTAAVYSRLKLSSVIATSSRMRLKSLARSVSSRLMSRDTWKPNIAKREQNTSCFSLPVYSRSEVQLLFTVHSLKAQERHYLKQTLNHGHEYLLSLNLPPLNSTAYPQLHTTFSKLHYSL